MSKLQKTERKRETGKTVMVPWTGGYDSTALVLMALSEGHSVHVPYVFIQNNLAGCSAELVARTRIHSYLSRRGLWRGSAPSVSYQVKDNGDSGLGYSYPKWISLACTDLPLGVSEVWVGYTGSDRTAQGFNLDHHVNLIPSITSSVALSQPGRSIEVKFPFFDVDKAEMLCHYAAVDVRPVFGMLANCPEGLSWESGCQCPKCDKIRSLRDILDRNIV